MKKKNKLLKNRLNKQLPFSEDVNSFIRKGGYSVKLGKSLKCSICDHDYSNDYNFKCKDYCFCPKCLSYNLVISDKKKVSESCVIGDNYYYITYSYDNDYRVETSRKVFDYGDNGDIVGIRNIKLNFARLVYSYNHNKWRKPTRTMFYYLGGNTISSYDNGGYVYIKCDGSKRPDMYKYYSHKKFDINFLKKEHLTVSENSNGVNKRTFKQIYKISKFWGRKYFNFPGERNLLEIIKQYNLCEYLSIEQVAQIQELDLFNDNHDKFELEKLIKLGSYEQMQHYIQVYLESGYSLLALNKDCVKWAINEHLSLEQLKILNKYNVKDLSFIDKKVKKERKDVYVKDFNDVLHAYYDVMGIYQGYEFSLPILPEDLVKRSAEMGNCLKDKYSEHNLNKFIFFVDKEDVKIAVHVNANGMIRECERTGHEKVTDSELAMIESFIKEKLGLFEERREMC